MSSNQANVDLLIETSWEVCNKVGGIYTVLSTKAKNLHKLYKDKVIFIGPDVWTDENPSPFFEESATVLRSWKAKADLPDGMAVRVGRWNVPGKPIAVLVKFDSMYAVKDEFYGKMWDLYGVDSLHAYGDYDEACAFSHAAGLVVESLYNYFDGDKKNVIAHFDEWTTGMGLLYTKWKLPKVATIFTTHATSIGRSICGNGKPLYDYLKGYNGDQMAFELNMQSKHSLEKAAAHQADCFTTVSDITAVECEQLLDRAPDIVTPNGFEPNFVPAKAKFAAARRVARESLLSVASALTGIEFDDDTFIVCTSGRSEYRNKGIDVYLDAMREISYKNPCRRILSYIMVPAWSGQPRACLLESINNGHSYRVDDPFITHSLFNYESDPIIQRIHSAGFSNDVNSCITVIYVPCYLNGADGVFNKSYYDLLIGMDATVFPSYYEPWGYTPLESVAFGVPTITTSLSGFGQWVMSSRGMDLNSTGVGVVARNDNNYHEVVSSIADDLKLLSCADAETRESISKQALTTADQANWNLFIEYYIDAFRIALDKEIQRNESK
ncbi:MAG: glycosyltransferase [Barnesiella sp.]|nr:glycosyltransferase [Barnesiella sp.]